MGKISFIIIFTCCFLYHNQLKAQNAFVHITLYTGTFDDTVKYKVFYKGNVIYENEYVEDPRIFYGIFLNIKGLKKKLNETLTFKFESGAYIDISTSLLLKSKIMVINLFNIGKPHIEISGLHTKLSKLRKKYKRTIDLNRYKEKK